MENKKLKVNNNTTELKQALAFSLIELMISLIAISIIAAAFAPVISKNISKRLQTGDIVTGEEIKMSGDCTEIDEYCQFCELNQGICAVCTRPCEAGEDNIGQIVNKDTCKCMKCSDKEKGDDNCTVSCVWNSKESRAYCTQCSEGYYVNKNNGKCIICPKGQYCSGGRVAKKCDDNQYQNEEGKTDCLNCATGATSTSGDTTCTPPVNCEVYDDITGACSKCGSNTYLHPETKKCVNQAGLPDGYYITEDTLKKCEEGYYCKGEARTICPAGYYCTNGIMTACIATDLSSAGASKCNCPANCSVCSVNGTCTTCATDYKSNGSGGCEQPLLTVDIKGLTWTLRNPGDPGGPPIPSNVGMCSVNGVCTGNDVPTCWQNGTAGNPATVYDYSGDRTVCNWFAAHIICEHSSFSVPSKTELGTLGLAGVLSIRACSAKGPGSFARCDDIKGCKGANNNHCRGSILAGNGTRKKAGQAMIGGEMYPKHVRTIIKATMYPMELHFLKDDTINVITIKNRIRERL